MKNLSSSGGATDETDIATALRHFANWAERASSYAAKRLDLHVTDLNLVGLLLDHPQGMSPREIIEHLGLTSGAATALIDRLERAAYVRRVPNPKDRRSVLIQLIPDAAEAPIAFYKARQDYYRNITANFSPEELSVVIRFLSEVTWIEPDGIVCTDESDLPAELRNGGR